jgi:hypothetical protein
VKTVLPISVTGDGHDFHEAFVNMFCRVAAMARKRPSPLSLAVPPESIGLIATLDEYYNGKLTAEQAVSKIDELFT